MKKLLIAGLVVAVAGSAWAASSTPNLAPHKLKPVVGNLSKTQERSPSHSKQFTQPFQASNTSTAVLTGTQAPVAPAKAQAGTPAALAEVPTFASAAEAEYYHLKVQGLPIPASLIEQIFGRPDQGGHVERNGGETWASAAPITFSAGGTFSDTGTTVGAVDDIPTNQVPPTFCNTSFFPTSSFGAGEVVYTFTLPGNYEVSASVCNNASYDSCLGIFNAAHEMVAVNDDGSGCTAWSSLLQPCCLEAGTYFLVVDGYGTATGTFSLTVNFGATPCQPAGCNDITCVGQDEGEPNEGPNADPINYGSIDCGVTVCGTVWADGGTRDTDWFELLLLEDSELTITSTVEEFDALMFVLDASAANILYTANNVGVCEGETITTQCLFAGTYYVWMGPAVFEGVPNEQEYSLSLTCTTCTLADPCEEPIVLGCGDTVTGSTIGNINYVGNAAPDAFYQIDISTAGPVTFSLCDAGTDYDSYIRLYDDCPVSGGVQIGADDDTCADPGLASEMTIALDAGTYWLVVEGFSSGEGNYSLSINCATCDPVVCNGQDEGEPNEGPNADPINYGSIDCGVTICGTTWADGGTRDTDWFELLLLEDSELTITSEVEMFDALMFVLDETAANILYQANNNGFCEGETITTMGLFAGTYYLWMGHSGFEGVPNEVGYSMTLTCTPVNISNPCDEPVVITCGDTVTGNTGDGFNYVGNPAPDVFYQVEVPATYDVTFSMCDGNTDYDSWLRLFDGCPIDGGNEIASIDDFCGLQSELTVTLSAGTYWLVVEGYASNFGNYSLAMTCGTSPCDGLPPVNCVGTQEVEPNEGWNDDNASYNEITCGETVCGSVWATGGNRDLDWYHFSHTGGDLQVDTQIEVFDCILFLTDFAVGGAIIASANNEPMCVAETLVYAGLPAGEYYFVIAHSSFDGVPDDQDYALTLTCLGDPCDGHVPVDCNGIAEAEPNEGWNADPPNDSYNDISNGDTMCGSVWADGGTRDLDWYRFTVTEVTNVRIVSEIDEFNAIVFLTDFDSNGGILTAADANGPCQGETILYECLDPGDYYAVITHNDFEGVPDDQNYALTLTFEACTPTDPCADIVTGDWTNGYYTVQRPAPAANHHNAVNGCEGISSAGYDELHMLTLAAPADLRLTMTGNGSADEVIFILTDCMFTESCVAGVDAGGSDTIPETMDVSDLPAGTYYIVADYWGSSETHPYSLVVRNLTIDVDGDNQPLTFAMEQNYPNPFNPTTSITWTQPELMPATLAVFNLAGQKVQDIDLGFRGPGVHNYTWDASQLSSGVYFYSLTTGGQTLTKKAVLLK